MRIRPGTSVRAYAVQAPGDTDVALAMICGPYDAACRLRDAWRKHRGIDASVVPITVTIDRVGADIRKPLAEHQRRSRRGKWRRET